MTTVVDFVYKCITREVARCLEVLTMLCRSLYTYIDVILTDRPPPPHTHKLFKCTQNLINPENSCNNILLMSNWWMRFLLFFFLRRLELVSGKIQCPRPQKALVHRNNHIDMYTYINILQDNSLSVGRYNTHATHQRWNKKNIHITASLRCWSNYQKPSSINNWFTWTIPKGKRSLLEHLCPSKKSARIMYS